MKTTFKSVALFVVVLGISAVGLSGTASAAHGSGGKMGSAHSGQVNHTPSRNMGSRSQESHKFDSRRYDWNRYGRYNYGRYPYFSSYCYPSWYPCYEPSYYVSQVCVVPQYCVSQPVVEECPPPCPTPVAEECPAPLCPEPCYSECSPCRPYYAGCDDYGYPGCYDRYWKDRDKWKDHDPKHGSSGKDGPPRVHPLTEIQHGAASGNLGKTAMKVAGNSRGGRR
jgi:hypothetical protein